MPSWREIGQTELLANDLSDWAVALIVFAVTFTALPLLKSYIGSRRRRWAQAGRELPVPIQVATLLVARTSRLFLWSVALYLAVAQLTLPYVFERASEIAIILASWMQAAIWAMSLVRFAIDQRSRRAAAPDPTLASSISIIHFVAGLLIWMMAFLLALDNLGVQIGPLLAGLGIGGIAVALAVQTVLGDLLASLSIALDKPFTVGDELAVDDLTGTVEHIGVKSTRLRSLSGEQIIVSNADILKSRVRNLGRMRERRCAFQLNVSYDTPIDKLRAIPKFVREIIEAQPRTRFDRCHLMSYTSTALQFEVVYHMLTADHNAYADVQQAINLEILERFKTLGVQFAVGAVIVPLSKP